MEKEFRIQGFLKVTNLVYMFLALIFVVFFSCYLKKTKGLDLNNDLLKTTKKTINKNRKSLSFSENYKEGKSKLFFPKFSKNLKIFKKSQKPLSNDSKVKYFARWDDTGSELEINFHQKLFVDANDQGFLFSKTATNCYLIPKLIFFDKISLTINLNMDDELLSLLGQSSYVFNIEEDVVRDEAAICGEKALSSLYNGSILGPDLLASNNELENSTRIEIAENNQVLNVKEGDLLVYLDGKWEISKDKDFVRNFDLFVVVDAVSSSKLNVFAYKKDKKYAFSVLEKPKSLIISDFSNIFSFARVIGKNKISAKIDKSRFIINQGDWVVKKKGHWKVIRSGKPEKFLSYIIDNEDFFVFEGIENYGKNKYIIGSIFDFLRSQKKECKLLISSNVNKRKNIKVRR